MTTLQKNMAAVPEHMPFSGLLLEKRRSKPAMPVYLLKSHLVSTEAWLPCAGLPTPSDQICNPNSGRSCQ